MKVPIIIKTPAEIRESIENGVLEFLEQEEMENEKDEV